MRGTRTYCFEVEGWLGESMGPSFPGMTLRREDGHTKLIGHVRDQAELHGLLRRCLDLGLTLVSVSSSGDALAAS